MVMAEVESPAKDEIDAMTADDLRAMAMEVLDAPVSELQRPEPDPAQPWLEHCDYSRPMRHERRMAADILAVFDRDGL